MPPYGRRRYHHCGPGNQVAKYRSRSKTDEACRQHDIAYGKIGRKAYFYHNAADDRFIRKMEARGTHRSRFYANVFKLKRAIAPSLSENDMPKRGRSPIRTPSKRRSRPYSPPRTPRKKTTKTANASTQTSAPRARSSGGGQATTASGPVTHSVRRARSRPKRTHWYNVCRRGVVTQTQHGQSVADNDAVIVGHATCPKVLMIRAFFRALLKALLTKAGRMPQSMDQSANFAAGTDKYEFVYRASQIVSAPTAQVDVVSNLSVENIALQFASNATLLALTREAQFLAINFIPQGDTVGAVQYKLTGGHVHFDVVSKFTMQNISVPDTDENDADNVEAVALDGKKYEGRGTGTTFVGQNTLSPPRQADDVNGVISAIGGTDDEREPMQAFLYSTVKRTGSEGIHPGQVKASYLRWKSTISMDSFISGLYPELSTNLRERCMLGKYRFFHFEQVIETAAQVRLSLEHEIMVGCYIRQGSDRITMPYNSYV